MLVMNPGFFMPYTLGVIRCKSKNKGKDAVVLKKPKEKGRSDSLVSIHE
jgi:hypothetical protein